MPPSNPEEKIILTLPDKTEYIVSIYKSDTFTVYYFCPQPCIQCIVPKNYDTAIIYNIDNSKELTDERRYKLCCLAFSFILSRHPNIITFKYQHHLSNSPLIHLHYLRDGQTWVMKYLAARISSEDEERLRIANIEARQKIPWVLIKDYIPVAEAEDLYEAATTMLEFFHSLNTTIGDQRFAELLTPWVYSIIGRDAYQVEFLLLDITYTIDPRIHVIAFEESSV